jgi:hypothetical protein
MPKNFEDFNFLGELKDGVIIFQTTEAHSGIDYYIIYFKNWKPYFNISVVNTDKAI